MYKSWRQRIDSAAGIQGASTVRGISLVRRIPLEISFAKTLRYELDAAIDNGIPKTSIKTIDPEPITQSSDSAEHVLAAIQHAINEEIKENVGLRTNEENDRGSKTSWDGDTLGITID